MYLCYMDESGTPELPGNTSHYILVGLSIPVWHWKLCDQEISQLKRKYFLEDTEIHCAWMLRRYTEQSKVPNFVQLSHAQRRVQVEKIRISELLRLQRASNPKLYRQTKKNFQQTAAYIHLPEDERRRFISEVAAAFAQWGFARLFAECINKVHFDPSRHPYSIDEMAFEQVVSRFEQYLQITSTAQGNYGLLIHDNNQTVAKRHTELMRRFHTRGTLWTHIERIIETPLFVDSQLTSMVQIADICSYALRRYLENGETGLFNQVFGRADRKDGVVVGVRHFTEPSCNCAICVAHRRA